jgi:23S rRNA (adenine2503-C2)-methyltransferase
MIYLQAVTPEALADAVEGVSLADARRIVGAVYRHDHLPRVVRNVRRSSVDAVRAAATLPELSARGTHRSRIDPFVKFALETADGHIIETVRIPLERAGRFSVCVSSQAGCALACSFCATGRMGLLRNLETWEIVEQVRVVRRSLDRARRERVHGIVFQGMGEPLANLDNVIETIRVATEPAGLAIDGRAITVCTAGIPRGIRRLGREAPKVRLGISITSARPSVRRRLMPIDQAHPLEEVLDAAAEHARLTRLAPMWAVTPMENVNDFEEDARELARLAQKFAEKTGLRPRISIVPYNAIDPPGQPQFVRSGSARESAFRKILSEAGLPSHMRYSGGADVRAACGQLAGAPY